MNKIFSRIVLFIKNRSFGDWVFAVLALIALVLRGPIFIEHFQKEGTLIHPVTIDGKLFPPRAERSVMIFWASWCGPCTLELKRINSAILAGELSPKNLYAVNMGEERKLVERTVAERHYVVPVIQDASGELARSLSVQATPTVAFIKEDGRIKWLSSGLSPMLIYRIKSFQKKLKATL